MTIDLQKKSWNILVIDDSKLSRAFVQKTLSTLNMKVHEAENVKTALSLVNEKKFDCILVDLIMPEQNGFEFIKLYKELKLPGYVPIVLMTGSEDLESKIQGLSIGADDYLRKPVNEKELIARVMSLLRLKDAYSQLYDKNLIITRELEAAKKIQQYIIPDNFSFISYPSISGKYLPIEDIGGDFFDCYSLDDHRTAFIIADVTGHGIPAALIMTMTKMIFNIYSRQHVSTSKLLSAVNKNMRNLLLDSQYITCFCAIYNSHSKKLRFTNAGHARPLFFQSEKKRILALDSFGLFIGIADQVDYEEKAIQVNDGDRLVLYTDGLTEIKNEQGEEYGETRLASFINANSHKKGEEFCNHLTSDFSRFSGSMKRNDDIAILNIEF